MKLIYDTTNNKLLPWPRIDDEPVVGLDAHLLEMTVLEEPQPAFDPATERLEKTETIDTASRTVTRGWSVIAVTPPTFTADQWVDHCGFDGKRPTTCLYLLLQLQAAGKSSPKLSAVQAWMDQMIAAGVMNPDEQLSDYPAAPYSFAEASGEALAVLNS